MCTEKNAGRDTLRTPPRVIWELNQAGRLSPKRRLRHAFIRRRPWPFVGFRSDVRPRLRRRIWRQRNRRLRRPREPAGRAATGGVSATGGSPGTGGASATGGSTGTGGAHATGGSTGTGGAARRAAQSERAGAVPRGKPAAAVRARAGSEVRRVGAGVTAEARPARGAPRVRPGSRRRPLVRLEARLVRRVRRRRRPPVDAAKWGFETGGNGWGNNELEYYTNRTENARRRAGNLVITATRQARRRTTCRYGTLQVHVGARSTRRASSRSVRSLRGAHPDPRGQGMWPAFWMLGDNIGSRRLADVRRDRHHGEHRQGAGDQPRQPARCPGYSGGNAADRHVHAARRRQARRRLPHLRDRVGPSADRAATSTTSCTRRDTRPTADRARRGCTTSRSSSS